MKRWCLLLLVWVAAQSGAETLSHGRFQNLAVYRPGGEVQRVVLFLSGEQGWNAQLSRSAQLLASQGALVAGIDSRALFADLERDGAECVFPDGDLENLSHFLQAYYRLPSYEPAVLVGHGTGATLSYAMLAQAPAETFAGGISIDFCPQLRLRKHLCEDRDVGFHRDQEGARRARTRQARSAVDSGADARRRRVRCGRHTTIRERGARKRDDAAAAGQELRELGGSSVGSGTPPRSVTAHREQRLPQRWPVCRSSKFRRSRPATTLAILISGDGGWAGIDKAVAASLADRASPSSVSIRCGTSGRSARHRARQPTSIASCVTTWRLGTGRMRC